MVSSCPISAVLVQSEHSKKYGKMLGSNSVMFGVISVTWVDGKDPSFPLATWAEGEVAPLRAGPPQLSGLGLIQAPGKLPCSLLVLTLHKTF